MVVVRGFDVESDVERSVRERDGVRITHHELEVALLRVVPAIERDFVFVDVETNVSPRMQGRGEKRCSAPASASDLEHVLAGKRAA